MSKGIDDPYNAYLLTALSARYRTCSWRVQASHRTGSRHVRFCEHTATLDHTLHDASLFFVCLMSDCPVITTATSEPMLHARCRHRQRFVILLRLAYTVGTVIGQPGCCDIDHYLKFNIRRCAVTTRQFHERPRYQQCWQRLFMSGPMLLCTSKPQRLSSAGVLQR